jgi:hypothetical protein
MATRQVGDETLSPRAYDLVFVGPEQDRDFSLRTLLGAGR